MGTINWKWLDDDSRSQKFVIPKSYYVPSGNVRPQHGAQTQKETLSGIDSKTLQEKMPIYETSPNEEGLSVNKSSPQK